MRHRNIRNCRESGARGMRLTAAKDRTFKTVRPNQETLTDASNASSRTPTTKSRLCRLTIRLRPGEDLSIGDKLEVWTRQ